jgi:5-methylcytosine-specific restriction endonuclease McrA
MIGIPTFPSCTCENTAVRYRVRSNGAGAYVLQCLTCGRELRSLKKTSPEVMNLAERIPFDESLGTAYADRQQALYKALYQERSEQRRAEWRAQYNAYLQSPEWRAKRLLVLKRDKYVCQGCLASQATQVHHLSYAHVFHEPLFDLVSVCDDCHAALFLLLGWCDRHCRLRRCRRHNRRQGLAGELESGQFAVPSARLVDCIPDGEPRLLRWRRARPRSVHAASFRALRRSINPSADVGGWSLGIAVP